MAIVTLDLLTFDLQLKSYLSILARPAPLCEKCRLATQQTL